MKVFNPVSYTHLDVYKRQYQGLPGTLRSGADQPVLARTSPGGKNERKPVIRLMGKIPAGSFSGGKRRTERNGLKNGSK